MRIINVSADINSQKIISQKIISQQGIVHADNKVKTEVHEATKVENTEKAQKAPQKGRKTKRVSFETV